jgi:hypothetical protein
MTHKNTKYLLMGTIALCAKYEYDILRIFDTEPIYDPSCCMILKNTKPCLFAWFGHNRAFESVDCRSRWSKMFGAEYPRRYRPQCTRWVIAWKPVFLNGTVIMTVAQALGDRPRSLALLHTYVLVFDNVQCTYTSSCDSVHEMNVIYERGRVGSSYMRRAR